VPELDIPPFDPIFVPVVLLDYKRENAEGKMIIRNTKVYGLKDGEILDFRLDNQRALLHSYANGRAWLIVVSSHPLVKIVQ
jgi:hypothetical protein